MCAAATLLLASSLLLKGKCTPTTYINSSEPLNVNIDGVAVGPVLTIGPKGVIDPASGTAISCNYSGASLTNEGGIAGGTNGACVSLISLPSVPDSALYNNIHATISGGAGAFGQKGGLGVYMYGGTSVVLRSVWNLTADWRG